MGKGIALVHKLRDPVMFEEYRRHCKAGLIQPGKLFLYKETGRDPWVLNFPTKNDWKHPSKLEYLEAGLVKFAETWQKQGIESIAFPLLGTHNGGLDTDLVKDLMFDRLSECDLKIEVYQYDPEAEDGMFLKFRDKWMQLGEDEVKSTTGIQLQYAKKITQMLEGGAIQSMIALANTRGVGLKTLEKLFEFAREEELPPTQMELL